MVKRERGIWFGPFVSFRVRDPLFSAMSRPVFCERKDSMPASFVVLCGTFASLSISSIVEGREGCNESLSKESVLKYVQ